MRTGHGRKIEKPGETSYGPRAARVRHPATPQPAESKEGPYE